MATVKLNTKEFASMLSKVSKCTVKGGVSIISELVEIRLASGVLSLRTTDTRNIMILRKNGVAGDDFVATIPLEIFEKIVSKTSKEEVTLEVDDKAVHLTGNGTYHFALTIEGDTPVTFEPLKMLEDPEVKIQFKKADFLEALKYTGDFVCSQYVDPTLSGFYFGEHVITTDLCNCAYLHKKFFDNDIMFYPPTLALINEIDDEQVMFLKKGRKIQFISSTCLIDSIMHSDTENFPVEEFNGYLKDDFGSCVTISKSEATQILDRVSFFVDMKSEFGATLLDFKPEGVAISDKGGKAAELLSIKEPVNFSEYTCYVGAQDMIKALSFEGEDDIKLWYANPTALRIESGNITRILALLDPNDLEGAINFEAADAATEAAVDFGADIPEPDAAPVEPTTMESAMDTIQW